MSDLRKAVWAAVNALEAGFHVSPRSMLHDRLKEALAQPEQEPVAWMVHGGEIWNTSVSPYRDERGIPLYAHPSPVPKGWQLVPKEPTPEMQRAMQQSEWPDEAYKAMLAAAPKPE